MTITTISQKKRKKSLKGKSPASNTVKKQQSGTPKADGKTKKRIFSEAAKLFKEHGYKATNMRGLANLVGIRPSSLYSHISSKDDLLEKICFDCATRFTIGMQKIIEKEISPLMMIEELIGLHIKIAKSDPTSITVFNDEWKHMSEEPLKDFKSLRKGYEMSFIHIIKEAIKQGELKIIDPELLMNTIFSSIKWIQLSGASEKKWSQKMLSEQVCDILLNGIKQ